jgi:hypothetical protein
VAALNPAQDDPTPPDRTRKLIHRGRAEVMQRSLFPSYADIGVLAIERLGGCDHGVVAARMIPRDSRKHFH